RESNGSSSNAASQSCAGTPKAFVQSIFRCRLDPSTPFRSAGALMSTMPDDVPGDGALDALREALRAAPDNTALRLHVAEALLNHGHAAEAEKEYRAGLAKTPNSLPMQLGLARAFSQQGKHSH